MDYDKRIVEETEKFCKNHKLQFEDIADFIGWVSFIRKEQYLKQVIELLENNK